MKRQGFLLECVGKGDEMTSKVPKCSEKPFLGTCTVQAAFKSKVMSSQQSHEMWIWRLQYFKFERRCLITENDSEERSLKSQKIEGFTEGASPYNSRRERGLNPTQRGLVFEDKRQPMPATTYVTLTDPCANMRSHSRASWFMLTQPECLRDSRRFVLGHSSRKPKGIVLK